MHRKGCPDTEGVTDGQDSRVDEWESELGLVLVFERGGLVYVYRSPQDAAGSIESTHLEEGFYLGALSDDGEVIEMRQDDLLLRSPPLVGWTEKHWHRSLGRTADRRNLRTATRLRGDNPAARRLLLAVQPDKQRPRRA